MHLQRKASRLVIENAAHDDGERLGLAIAYQGRVFGGENISTTTSGSTGKPKTITHRAEDLIQNADTFNQFVGLGPDTRMLHVMKIGHMAGQLNTILCPLLAGGVVVMADEFSPQSAMTFWKTAIDTKANAVWLAPQMAQTILSLDRNPDSEEYARAEMKFCFVGTGALPEKLYHAWLKKYGVPLLQSYGMSEIMLASTNLREDHRAGSVGRVLPTVDARISYVSELFIDTLFVKNFPTGDKAWMDERGYLYIRGRL